MTTQAALRRLLLQVRGWISPHPENPKGIRFEAYLPEVHEWMETVDRETAPAPLAGGELGESPADRRD